MAVPNAIGYRAVAVSGSSAGRCHWQPWFPRQLGRALPGRHLSAAVRSHPPSVPSPPSGQIPVANCP
jgi:hypothetical protein